MMQDDEGKNGRFQITLDNARMGGEGEILFEMPDGSVPLRLRRNGDILVHDKVAENDKAVVEAFREFISGAHPLMRNRVALLEETIRWLILHPAHPQQDQPPPDVQDLLDELFPPQENGTAGAWRFRR